MKYYILGTDCKVKYGTFDTVTVYNRALSASEIQQLYREPFSFMQGDLPVTQMYEYAAAGVVVTPYYYRGLILIPIIPFGLYYWRRKCAA